MFESSGRRGNKAAPAFCPSSSIWSVDQLDTAPYMPPYHPSQLLPSGPEERLEQREEGLSQSWCGLRISRVSNAFCQGIVKCQPFCVVHRCVLLRLETPVQTLCMEVFSIRDETLSGFLLSAPNTGE